jgi:hypothetical protein
MFKKATTNPNAMLIICNRQATSSRIAGGIATEAISILCLRSCSVLQITPEVKSGDRGGDTAHSLFYPSSHSAKHDEHSFYIHQSHERIAIQTSQKLCEDL